MPFTPPEGLPDITATTTDPQGNTSEVSALRRITPVALPPSLRVVPDHSLTFGAASGDPLAIQDPDAGPLEAMWNLKLSVTAGTLTLAGTTGLTGSGDGTGSLSYSGSFAAVNAALAGMIFTPPAGPHVFATLSLLAQSNGASPCQTQFALTDGVFVVNSALDSGPGSLRQAILDANTVVGPAFVIDFDLPGAGAGHRTGHSACPHHRIRHPGRHHAAGIRRHAAGSPGWANGGKLGPTCDLRWVPHHSWSRFPGHRDRVNHERSPHGSGFRRRPEHPALPLRFERQCRGSQ